MHSSEMSKNDFKASADGCVKDVVGEFMKRRQIWANNLMSRRFELESRLSCYSGL